MNTKKLAGKRKLPITGWGAQNCFAGVYLALLGRPKKRLNFFFTEWAFPSGQIVPTTCRSILHPSRASQLPYLAKIRCFSDFIDFPVFFVKKSFKGCPSNGRVRAGGQQRALLALSARTKACLLAWLVLPTRPEAVLAALPIFMVEATPNTRVAVKGAWN